MTELEHILKKYEDALELAERSTVSQTEHIKHLQKMIRETKSFINKRGRL